jgi:hypothetical protein
MNEGNSKPISVLRTLLYFHIYVAGYWTPHSDSGIRRFILRDGIRYVLYHMY